MKENQPVTNCNHLKKVVGIVRNCSDLDLNMGTSCTHVQIGEPVTNCHGLDCSEKSAKLKDSGIPWIGDTPEHWILCRFKDFLSLNTTASDSLTKIGLENIESGTGKYIASNSKFDGNGTAFSKNDIVYGKLRPYLMKVWQAEFEGNAVGDFFVFRCKNNCNPAYVKYILLSDGFTKIVVSSVYGTKMPRVSSDFFLNLSFYLPPLEEQERIATWLDGKCGEIDELIEVEQQMISDLEAYRQAVITEAVTHGLNSDTPVRYSGSEWIGDVPLGWEAIPVQHFFEFRNGYTPSKSETSFWTNGTIPWYRMEDIRKSGRKLNESIQYITPEAVKNGGMFEAGSYILAICTASIGEHAMLIADSLANQQFTNLKIRKSLDNRVDKQYIFYYMFILGKFCRETAIGTTFPYADMACVKNFIVPTPPLSEQQEIAAFLDAKCAEIDELIIVTQEKIETLRQYRQSLILEAVTGKTTIK